MELRKGQKIPLNENFLTVKFERNAGNIEIDTAAFLQCGNSKVEDEDFIFYGNPRHNSGGIVHKENDSLDINLPKIPLRIDKISFTATIYDADKRRQNFSQVDNAVFRIYSAQTGEEIANFELEKFYRETAIVIGEIYRYKGSWKFNAVGAGFYGGLAALCKNFGIEVIEEVQPIEEPPPKIVIPPPTKKIELQRGQRHNLSVKNGKLGEISINLKWSSPQKTKKNIDLDLCCLYELEDEFVGAVQALGNFFGSLNEEPYIKLNRDDKTGQTYNGETIKINGRFLKKFRRVLVFATIYSGAANWKVAQGILTIKTPNDAEIVINLDEYSSKKSTCAIVLFENIGNTFSVEKILNFYYDSQEMDNDFDWGLQWTTGSKE